MSTVKATPRQLVNTANWMARIDSSVRLDEIVMPGSHDAGMSVLEHCTLAGIKDQTKTQEYSLGQQMLDGSRYFDIRVDYDHDELVTYHRNEDGWGCNGQTLKSALDQTASFLSAHNSETVILVFSKPRKDSGHDDMYTKTRTEVLLNQYDSHIYKNDYDPKVNLAVIPLGTCRGKMILVFAYYDYNSAANGRFRYAGGDVYTWGDLTVYNQYANTTNYDTMKEFELNEWKNYGGLGKGMFFVLSWTLTPSISHPYSIKYLADEANSRLGDVLYQEIITNKLSKPNIVYIDYFDYNLGQTIVMFNF